MNLKEVNTVKDLQTIVSHYKLNGKTIGFVPTMGFLHQGHMSLVQKAKSQSDIVITSIYINPTQFNDLNDFNNYPKDLERDKELLNDNECDYVFIPNQSEIESIPSKSIQLDGLDKVMEGRYRPGHFQGVVEVVYRLFEACKPDIAFFGEKDFQQLMVIQKMVEKLNLPIQIEGVPIVRESNGLAMSSRNVRLSPKAREKAGAIYTALAEYKLKSKQDVTKRLEKIGFELEYLEEYNFNSSKRLFVAGTYEGVRLIDNVEL